jgi:hypothetical protein
LKSYPQADAVCAACHGKDGNTPIDPSYPKLAGQYRDFLQRSLLDYQSGARKNAISAGAAAAARRAPTSPTSPPSTRACLARCACGTEAGRAGVRASR